MPSPLGSPARFVRYRFDQEVIVRLLRRVRMWSHEQIHVKQELFTQPFTTELLAEYLDGRSRR
jgi:hypothetical protein